MSPPDGTVTTVAGRGDQQNLTSFGAGDGSPATEVQLGRELTAIGVGPEGSLYIADHQADNVRVAGPDGVISTVAGKGTQGGGYAEPVAVAVDPTGGVYIADTSYTAHYVGPDGAMSSATDRHTVDAAS